MKSAKTGKRERLFGGFTTTELATGLGLPRRRVFDYLVDTEKRLGRPMGPQDAFLFIYQMVDRRLSEELNWGSRDYVNL